MAINKNALIRYRELDRCFRKKGRKYFIDDLLIAVNEALTEFNGQESGINRRQLFDDIRYMESEQGWSIPLGKYRDGKKFYYSYTEPEFSITQQALTDSERTHLENAIAVLSHFSGTPQFEWLQETIPVLQDKLSIKNSSREIIELQSNFDLIGLSFLNPLYDAIIQKQVLSVLYKEFKSEEPYKLTFHPYYLKQYNNRWFVFGFNEEKQVPVWNLALDRILEIGYLSASYQEDLTDWKDYFYDLIGVTKPYKEEPTNVKLEIAKNLAPYILTKPLHASQKSNWLEDKLIVEIEVIPNYELRSLILSFGSSIRVIEPDVLKNDIKTEVKNLATLYD